MYGGRLHASSDVGLRGYTPSDTAYPNGNTHGSIIQLNESFYIFDHRFTNACSYCRQGVAEKIEMDENGFFKAAEATSCGLNGGPLDGEGMYPSYIVCFLKNIKLEKDASKEERLSKMHMSRRTAVTERAVKMPILPICRMDVWQDLSILI